MSCSKIFTNKQAFFHTDIRLQRNALLNMRKKLNFYSYMHVYSAFFIGIFVGKKLINQRCLVMMTKKFHWNKYTNNALENFKSNGIIRNMNE